MSTKNTLSAPHLFRQAFAVAALIILVGLYLGITVSPVFFGLPALVAFGLMLTAVTGFCPMVYLLRHAPWNSHRDVGGNRGKDQVVVQASFTRRE